MSLTVARSSLPRAETRSTSPVHFSCSAPHGSPGRRIRLLMVRTALSVSGYLGRPSCTRQRKQEFGTTDARRCTPMHRAVRRSGDATSNLSQCRLSTWIGGAPTLPSWPGLTRPTTPGRWCVDGRVKPGHDGWVGAVPFARRTNQCGGAGHGPAPCIRRREVLARPVVPRARPPRCRPATGSPSPGRRRACRRAPGGPPPAPSQTSECRTSAAPPGHRGG